MRSSSGLRRVPTEACFTSNWSHPWALADPKGHPSAERTRVIERSAHRMARPLAWGHRASTTGPRGSPVTPASQEIVAEAGSTGVRGRYLDAGRVPFEHPWLEARPRWAAEC